MHTALRYIICHAQRTALYYLSCTPHCAILSVLHTALRYIICLMTTKNTIAFDPIKFIYNGKTRCGLIVQI